jgi:signal transduction histidine kinase
MDNNTILIVDDEESLRLTLRLRLMAQGFNILLAEDGEAGLEALRNNSVDLVLLDINMPKMDGIETLRHITEEFSNVDVMMLTGFADFSTAIDCLKKGAKDYLVKPIEITELVSRVRSSLRARTSERSLKEMQSKFMSTFLHDMLNPLKTIGSTIDQLKDGTEGAFSEDQNVLLNYLTDLSDRLLHRVRNFIDISLFEEGKITLVKNPMDLEMFLQTVCLRYEIAAKRKKLHFSKMIEKGMPQVSCDFDRIDTVVNSLLDNAIKYSTENGSVSINASKTTMQYDGKTIEGIEVAVKDSGTGIPASELPGIFSKYKPDGSPEAKIPSYSLAIAKHIIDAHKGVIKVSSEDGKGSTFSFMLPL